MQRLWTVSLPGISTSATNVDVSQLPSTPKTFVIPLPSDTVDVRKSVVRFGEAHR